MRAFWARERGRNSNRRRFTALPPSEISSAIYCYGADEASRGWRQWKGRQQKKKNVTLLDVLAGGGDKEDAREMELGKSALRENISPLGGTKKWQMHPTVQPGNYEGAHIQIDTLPDNKMQCNVL